MNQASINLMIVEDSALIRKLLEKIVHSDGALNLIATAANGQEALEEVDTHKNLDLILLDLEMPVMGGLEAIPLLLKKNPKLKILIVSSIVSPEANCTVQALSLGAADYIEKPNSRLTIEQFARNLLVKIHDVCLSDVEYHEPKKEFYPIAQKESLVSALSVTRFRPEIIAIASSTGGPRALIEVLGEFSESFLNNNIIIITQHIKDDFIDLLVSNLRSISKLNCKKAEDNEQLHLGQIYLAPSGFHLEITKVRGDFIAHLSSSPPENFCRPSADPMFNSLAKASIRSLAIVLTGIGSDGLIGAIALAEKNNLVIAQDKETSVVWGMPGAVANAGICHAILPLHKIASYVEKGMN